PQLPRGLQFRCACSGEAAEGIDRTVDDYTSQPGGHMLLALDVRQLAMQLEKDLLCDVFCPSCIAQIILGNDEYHRMMASESRLVGCDRAVVGRPVSGPVYLAAVSGDCLG